MHTSPEQPQNTTENNIGGLSVGRPSAHTEKYIVKAMHEYAAQQLSEYKEYFELAERAKQVLRDKGYGWTGLDILETCKLVPNND